MKRTAFIFHELYLWHNTGQAALEVPPSLGVQPDQHVEDPETKRRIKNLIEVSGLADRLIHVKPAKAKAANIAAVHDEKYIRAIRRMSGAGGGNASLNGFGDAPFGAGSYEIALLAAGGAMRAVDMVWKGGADNAYALIRPPGHHALPESGMGFCIFNNAAVAIRALRAKTDARVAHVDWDVHHGNGTQKIFYREPVFTVSIHQDGCFPPRSGGADEIGSGAGRGCNMNIPLPPGCGNEAYEKAVEELVVPALADYRPDIITVSCGLDPAAADPLARMMVTPSGFRRMTRLLADAAQSLCGGRIVMLHEGGYSRAFAPFCGLAVIEELAQWRSGVPDPFKDYEAMGGQKIMPHQRSLLNRLKRHFSAVRRRSRAFSKPGRG